MQNEISDEGPERKYFTLIPHLVDDAGLSPHAVRLYLHMKRRTGESPKGICYETTRNLAKSCEMSVGMIARAKKELKDAGFIRVHIRERKHGEFDGHNVEIVDLWVENSLKYSTSSQCEQDQTHPYEQDRSQCETKKNPDLSRPPAKNRQKKKMLATTCPAA